MIRSVLASLAAAAAGGIVATAGCGSECTVGTSRCDGAGTRQVCEDPSAGGPPGGSAGAISWNDEPCPSDNPFCVVLSSGASCVAIPDRIPVCEGAASQGLSLCVDGGTEGVIAGACVEGFVFASSVCLGPFACTIGVGGAFCASANPQVDAGQDAGVDAPAE